jgi:hypothetical protein
MEVRDGVKQLAAMRHQGDTEILSSLSPSAASAAIFASIGCLAMLHRTGRWGR